MGTALGIIGAVTGIVGAVAGIAGAVLGYFGYRYSQTLKALDLRLELRKQITETRTTLSELPELLRLSRSSRDNVLAARGILRTGPHEQWKTIWATDVTTSRNLVDELPGAETTYEGASHQELENELIKVHSITVKATRIRDRYLAELASDDRDRERI